MERSRRDTYLVIHDFMLRNLNLKGVSLLLYARIYGFCTGKPDEGFFESRAKTAHALNVTERAVINATKYLLDRGLIIEHGAHVTASGRTTKRYFLTEPASDERSSDEASSGERRSGEQTSPERDSGEIPSSEQSDRKTDSTGENFSSLRVKKVHPIIKKEKKVKEINGPNPIRRDFREYDC